MHSQINIHLKYCQPFTLVLTFPVFFIKHFTNKVDKLRDNVATEHVTSTLVTGRTTATFSSFEKVSQLTVNECILNSAHKSCELDAIPTKLLIECLDSILPSLTNLFSLLSPIYYPFSHRSILPSLTDLFSLLSPIYSPFSHRYILPSITDLFSLLSSIYSPFSHRSILPSLTDLFSILSPIYSPFSHRSILPSLTDLFSILSPIYSPFSHRSILPSLTYLFSLLSLIYSTLLLHLASSHNASNEFMSHLFSKRGVLITMI